MVISGDLSEHIDTNFKGFNHSKISYIEKCALYVMKLRKIHLVSTVKINRVKILYQTLKILKNPVITRKFL